MVWEKLNISPFRLLRNHNSLYFTELQIVRDLHIINPRSEVSWDCELLGVVGFKGRYFSAL